jgi:hypothetical protein
VRWWNASEEDDDDDDEDDDAAFKKYSADKNEIGDIAFFV